MQGQRNLATFMKILLVKRLESSFHAFQETLGRFIKSHELVLQAFDDGFVYTSQKHSHKVLEFLEEGDDDAIDALIEEEKAEEFSAVEIHSRLPRACCIRPRHTAGDSTVLDGIKRDPKWTEFKRELDTLPTFKTESSSSSASSPIPPNISRSASKRKWRKDATI